MAANKRFSQLAFLVGVVVIWILSACAAPSETPTSTPTLISPTSAPVGTMPTGSPQMPGAQSIPPAVSPTPPKASCAIASSIAKARSQEALLVTLVPTIQQSAQECAMTVEIRVEPGSYGVSAGEINLAFDPTVLRVVEVQPGGLLGGGLLEGMKAVDNAKGMVRYALARRGPTSAPTATGLLARLQIELLPSAKRGNYLLTVAKAGFADEKFVDIPKIESSDVSLIVP